MAVKAERRLVFGDVAELYERARPAYPDELVHDVIACAGIDGSGDALEVGAGTGKATRQFAARGLSVLALEPSPRMAAVARQACAAYERVTIEQRDFEHFTARGRQFQLLFSAQAWHWISPEVRYIRAREALAPGGLLAAFWNRPRWEDTPLRAELVEAYGRAAPDFDPAAGPDPMHPATDTMPELGEGWQREIASQRGFQRPQVRCYAWSCTYSKNGYLELLQTHSGHIVRSEAQRRAILEEVGAVIERNGGSMRLELATVLCLATAA